MSIVDIPHVAPADYIAPPQPDPARFGLFSIANIIEDPDLRYEVGIEWEPIACSAAGVLTMICPPDGADTREGYPLTARQGGEGLVQATPFAVLGSYLCSAFSRPLDEAENRARQHLAMGEERAVEYAIATGIADNMPSFAGAVDLTPTATLDVEGGFRVLEGYLGANYGGVGAIHAPRVAAPFGTAMSRQGQRLETILGTLVAFGGGYDLAGVGPDGTAAPAGSAWLYATSRPTIRRSEVIVTPDEDHRPQTTNNNVEIFAQRIYSVGWECVTAAVRVDIAGAGTASIDGGTP